MSDPIKTQLKVVLLVAHPDDEVIYFLPVLFSARMAKISLVVVCISCGQNKIRRQEFEDSMHFWDLKYEILDHPIQRNRFPDYEYSFLQALDRLQIGISRVDVLLTHSAVGDDRYHPQHSRLNKLGRSLSRRYRKTLVVYDPYPRDNFILLFGNHYRLAKGRLIIRLFKGAYRAVVHRFFRSKHTVIVRANSKFFETINHIDERIYKSENIATARLNRESWGFSSANDEALRRILGFDKS